MARDLKESKPYADGIRKFNAQIAELIESWKPFVRTDDAVLFDLLAQLAPNDVTRHRILVENPETLYGFARRELFAFAPDPAP